MTIAISADEATILRDVLERRILEMKKEVWHTDHRDFRDLLIKREAALEHILEQLNAPVAG